MSRDEIIALARWTAIVVVVVIDDPKIRQPDYDHDYDNDNDNDNWRVGSSLKMPRPQAI